MYNIDNKYGLPKDVINKEFLLQLIGRNEMIIENYKCIKRYSDEEIIIMANKYSIKICGTHLEIKYYNSESMIIGGCIYEISFF